MSSHAAGVISSEAVAGMRGNAAGSGNGAAALRAAGMARQREWRGSAAGDSSNRRRPYDGRHVDRVAMVRHLIEPSHHEQLCAVRAVQPRVAGATEGRARRGERDVRREVRAVPGVDERGPTTARRAQQPVEHRRALVQLVVAAVESVVGQRFEQREDGRTVDLGRRAEPCAIDDVAVIEQEDVLAERVRPLAHALPEGEERPKVGVAALAVAQAVGVKVRGDEAVHVGRDEQVDV